MATATLSRPNHKRLSRAADKLLAKYRASQRPQRYEAQDDGEFVVFQDLPVFKEHEADDGFYYGKQELEWICHNVNERIRRSGDFVPVCVQHTADPGQDKNDPPVIGFAGPFHVRKFTDEEPIWCIAGNFRIFKDDEKTFRRHPRRSVELWVEDDPQDRFFDPISVLGAETPRLDLGLAYSRINPTRRIARYQAAPVAAFPSGSNTFVPSLGPKKKHDKESAQVSEGALSPDAVKQIVEALQATSEFQFVRELMKQSGGAEGDDDSDADGGQDAGEPSADLPQHGEEKPEKKNVELMKKYAAEGNDEEFNKLYDGMDDDARKKCMQYALNGDEADDVDDEPATPAEPKPEEEPRDKMNYAKAIEQVKKNSVPLDKFAKLERDHNDLKANYAKLQTRVNDAEAKAAKEARHAVRYSKLRDLEAEGFVLDPAEEIKDVIDLSDEQFDKHVAKIHKHYQRVNSDGLNQVVRMSKPENLEKQATEQGKRNDESNRIRDYALANKISYQKAKEKLAAEDKANAA